MLRLIWIDNDDKKTNNNEYEVKKNCKINTTIGDNDNKTVIIMVITIMIIIMLIIIIIIIVNAI